MSLKGKLNRLKSHMSLDIPAQSQPVQPNQTSNQDHVPFLDKWTNIAAKPFQFEEEHILVREVAYPLHYQHGHYRFEELYEVVEKWNQLDSSHPLSTRERRVEDLLFFDTETTGLSHGVGNTIFLLGCARIQEQKLLVKQYFMPGPEAEVAFYHAFLSDSMDLKNLVTYNGKAFDWPQVKTRHTLVRDAVPKLPPFGHYDLLHGARRLWKDTLESCRLSIVEENILGIKRQDDIPGYLAPMLYFDFLREKDPEVIQGVLVHNEGDMLSLVTLYIHLSKMLLGQYDKSISSRELYELGRWFEHIGEEDRALSFYKLGLEQGSSEDIKLEMALASLYKKHGFIDNALDLWKDIEKRIHLVPPSVFIELSKLYEHQYKEYEQALHYARKAYSCWKQESRLSRGKTKIDREKDQFMKRIERLERKCEKE